MSEPKAPAVPSEEERKTAASAAQHFALWQMMEPLQIPASRIQPWIEALTVLLVDHGAAAKAEGAAEQDRRWATEVLCSDHYHPDFEVGLPSYCPRCAGDAEGAAEERRKIVEWLRTHIPDSAYGPVLITAAGMIERGGHER